MSQKPETPKHAASVRRDQRHDLAKPQVPQGGARKDRKRWCGGKPGREHQPVCLTYAEAKPSSILARDSETASWRVLVCERCGKEMALWYPMPRSTKPKPTWVTK